MPRILYLNNCKGGDIHAGTYTQESDGSRWGRSYRTAASGEAPDVRSYIDVTLPDDAALSFAVIDAAIDEAVAQIGTLAHGTCYDQQTRHGRVEMLLEPGFDSVPTLKAAVRQVATLVNSSGRPFSRPPTQTA